MEKRKSLIWQVPFLLMLIVGTVLIIWQQHNMPYRKCEGPIFGTYYHVTYQSDKDMQEEINDALNRVDASLSPFNPNSVITKVNNNEDVIVDKLFADVFRISQQVSKETQGAFDITVAPLVNLWGFGFKQEKEPSVSAIDSIRNFVGYEKVKLGGDDRVKKTDKRIQLDCSAVAKGYASDVVAAVLRQHDISNYMVEIGGEIVTKGVNESRLPWRIGVNKPSDDPMQQSQEIQTILNVTDKAMATSGNYRNFYYRDGKKVAHTIDPKSGRPVQHSLLSATVLAANCATADAYATSFMVMGMEKAKDVLAKHPELMAYFIFAGKDGNYEVWYSPSLRDKIVDN